MRALPLPSVETGCSGERSAARGADQNTAERS